MKNEFLEEIWRVREKLAARYDYDLHRMVVHLQEEQAKHGDRLVQPPPHRAPAQPALALREEPPRYSGPSGSVK